jgi:putative protease
MQKTKIVLQLIRLNYLEVNIYMTKVELLAPVGDWNCLKAAVQNGADAVYFGVEQFNARMYAANFNVEDMKQVIDYCKLRNVKTNLTLNTLLENCEFDNAVDLAKEAYKAGVDAIIVQDLGLAKYLIDNIPGLPIHASTQMTVHNLQGVLKLEKLGFDRVVLSRELSCEEIEYICKNCKVEIETFIHGALCICYSGQCLFSSVVGGRSGNRGKCAGPCRLPYELISENAETHERKSIDKGYLLSTKDLCGIAYLPRLIQAGVKCFKIEGRMKSPEYVATVTRIYRKYIDMVLNNDDFIIDEKDINDLMQVFNRGGFSDGHLDSKHNRNLIFPEKPSNMGIYLGTIKKYNSNKGHITLQLEEDLELGDSISVSNEASKYLVSELMIKNVNQKKVSANTEVTIGRMKGNIKVGDKVYRISSKALSDFAKASYDNCENKKIPLNCTVTIKKNTPISMEISTNKNTCYNELYSSIYVKEISNMIPIDALKTPISVERVVKQISKTTNTPFSFENITVLLDDGLYVPSISTLNELRRTALEKVEQEILSRAKRTLLDLSRKSKESITYTPNVKNPEISVLFRQLDLDFDYTKLDKEKITNIYVSLELFISKKYSKVISYFSDNYNLYIYVPSIIKTNYKNIALSTIEQAVMIYNIKGFIVSNIGDFELLKKYSKDYEFIGNYTLNVFNNNTMEEYRKLGLSRITLSRELNQELIKEMLANANINTEMIVYGNLPLMASSYCFLGETNKCYPDCGTNCKKNNKYYLKDRLGFNFRVVPNSIETVTLICNSKTLSVSTKDLPVNFVRLDILDESINEINEAVDKAYNREKLEGLQYTNGNLYREV